MSHVTPHVCLSESPYMCMVKDTHVKLL